tara:strand:+ start:333 stop:824 length:492 start_codon:yes stop_codon:yes gene_type:complete
MKNFPEKIGITDSKICFNNCSIFSITFPPDEEFAMKSKIGWNPWGYNFSFTYDFSTGELISSDDYSLINVEESIEDSLMALKVYEEGPEWIVKYIDELNSEQGGESYKSISFPSSDIEDIYIGNECYEMDSNPEIENFYNYVYGEGYNTLVKVSNAVVKFLQG